VEELLDLQLDFETKLEEVEDESAEKLEALQQQLADGTAKSE